MESVGWEMGTRGNIRKDGEIGDISGFGRVSSVSYCSVDVQIRSGVNEIKVQLAKAEKDCRICQLGLESNNHESGVAIELGCSSNDDLVLRLGLRLEEITFDGEENDKATQNEAQ
ncbi:hypothetical protein V6N12_071171 [Hibiscus sabdariffa]|uniref:Uncharacterized protein n=1 Tax=Hibiscus sabdariffa TaxID=183260 RepID=A0ABR2FJ08_9ROSI